jgi:uncharacterized LabA/DUF88 family protein
LAPKKQKPRRVIFLVDGFNVYHSLVNQIYNKQKNKKHYIKYKWLDLNRLCNFYIKPKENDKIVAIYYFTTLITWNPDKRKRHEIYIDALKTKNIEIELGAFKDKHIKYIYSKRNQDRIYLKLNFIKPSEKRTDVNIAVKMLELAYKDKFDKIMVISGDTDLIPAIKYIIKNFSQKKIGTVMPMGSKSKDIKKIIDPYYFYRIKEIQLESSLFPKEIAVSGRPPIECPDEWQIDLLESLWAY